MTQSAQANCPKCNKTTRIEITKTDGINYEGYCSECRTPASGFFVLVLDYNIEPAGTIIEPLTDRAMQRAGSPGITKGHRYTFRTPSDAAQFVREAEANGFTFKGKQFLQGL